MGCYTTSQRQACGVPLNVPAPGTRVYRTEEETDLAHLWSQVQGTDGPGVGVDLDVQSSCAGLIQTHLPVPIACCYDPLPQMHGSTWGPARAMPHFDFPRSKFTPHPGAASGRPPPLCLTYPNPGIRVNNLNSGPDRQIHSKPESSAVTMSAMPS